MLLSAPAIAVSSIPRRKVIHSRSHWTEFETTRLIRGSSNLRFITRSVSKEGNTSVESDVPFPSDYIDLLKQAKKATELALKDGKQLMEIEFPTAGLESVPGDGEGGNEMTDSMQLIREFCDILVTPEKARQTRIVSLNTEANPTIMIDHNEKMEAPTILRFMLLAFLNTSTMEPF
ncbi:protein of unknown function DUF1995 - like 2 [Theobroma cacao]|nr:protein of unknown function DUF1995 - like 2 [Theobroma cacao]